jgi:hypothetical protein
MTGGENMNKIERDVRFLKFYSAAVTLLLLVFLVSAFTMSGNQKFKEIDVERINVVESDGSLRMVISNSQRQHPGISGGQTIKRTEPREPGIIFFCENGDECGGLAYSAKKTGDKVEAYGGLTFDQFMQDETVKLAYVDSGGWRRAGITIQDRSNITEPEWGKLYENAVKMPRGPERDQAMKPLLAPIRAFFGKTRENGSGLFFADTEGRTRITMIVDASGNPRLNFLDQDGKVIQSFPSNQK